MTGRERLIRAADDGRAGSLANRLRSRRFAAFERFAAQHGRAPRVIDLGGTPDYWEARGWADGPAVVTLVNLKRFEQRSAHVIPTVGDATSVRFEDGAFDIVFSNSVIEHLATLDRQHAMAREIRRLAPAYWVQTPNFWFPVEPHFLTPAWHWLPKRARVHVLTRRGVGWTDRADRARAHEVVHEIRLLRRRELARMFPDGQLVPERFGGLVKSWTAVRG